MANDNLRIKMDDVDFFEVDIDNPPYNPDMAPEDYRQEVIEDNDKFVNEVLNAKLLSMAAPCPCRTGEVVRKNQTRAKLMGMNPAQMPLMLDQEDIDAVKFGVVAMSTKGKYTDIACIVRECRQCHHVDIHGDSTVITRLLAESYTHYADAQDQLVATDLEADPNVEIDIDEISETNGFIAETIE